MTASFKRAGHVRELIGQVVRLAVAGLGSALGRYPVGNTGRARAPIAQAMPRPADLRLIIEADDPPR